MHNVSLLLILITITPSLLCMDNNLTVAQNVLIQNTTRLSHDTVCACALISKNYNKATLETIELRKNFLKNYALSKGTPITDEQVTWHRNGSAYLLIDQQKNNFTFKLIYLADNGIPLETSSNEIKKTYTYQRDNHPHHPFFSHTGTAHLHEFGFVIIPDDGSAMNMIKYSLSTKHSPKVSRCLIDLDDKCGELVNFVVFLHFPALVQAFLQSTQVHEGLTYLHNYYPQIRADDTATIYNIMGVTIPDDYKLSKEFDCYSSPFKSFDDQETNPFIIRVKNAIIKKYNAQQDNNKKQI